MAPNGIMGIPPFPTPSPPYQGGKGMGKGGFRTARLYVL